jgi:hypothetical protein
LPHKFNLSWPPSGFVTIFADYPSICLKCVSPKAFQSNTVKAKMSAKTCHILSPGTGLTPGAVTCRPCGTFESTFAPRFAEAATRFARRNAMKAGKAQSTVRVPLKL